LNRASEDAAESAPYYTVVEPDGLNMKTSYTCLVVGAGPAGSSAAYTFAKNGIDVCLVDKAAFPREKLCGGLLTRRTQKIFSDIFESGWDDLYEHRSNGALFFHKGQQINAIENYGELYFCNRGSFDNTLLEKVIATGADVVLGDRVEIVDTIAKTCRLRSGRQLGYRYLIGADGVNSVVARAVTSRGFDRSSCAFAVQAETQAAGCGENDMARPEIHFGEIDWGYGWVFPKKNGCSVGLGGLYPKNRDIRTRFSEFYAARNGQPCPDQLKGHFIPFCNYVRKAVVNDTVLVGDAAGLVDPITGEGIAHAIESGHQSALAVISVLAGSNTSVAGAYENYYTHTAREMDRAYMIRNFLFSDYTKALFISALSRTRTMPYHFMDLLSGEITYSKMLSIMQQKAIKLVFR